MPWYSREYFNSHKALSFTDDYCQRLQAVGCGRRRGTFAFQLSKMSDRLLYQSEAEQLMLGRGLVIAEPKVPFFRFSRGLWNPG